MKSRIISAFGSIAIMVYAITAISCGGGGSNITPTPTPDPPGPPDQVGVKDNVEVIGSSSPLTYVSKNDDSMTFNVAGDPVGQEPEIGKILMGHQDGGFIRRVEAVSYQGGQMVVDTGPASLADAVEELSFSQTLQFDRSVSTGEDGLPPHTVSQAGQIRIDLSGTELFSDEYITVKLTNGVVDFTPTINARADLSWGHVDYFKATAEGRLSFNFDVEATSDIERSFKKEVKVFEKTQDFWQFFGAVPVAERVTLRLYAGVDGSGELHGKAGAGFNSTTTLEIGAEYRNDSWRAVNEFTTDFNAHPPYIEIEGEFGVRAYVRPEIEVLFYNTAGPTLTAEPYMSFDAQGVLVPLQEVPYYNVDWQLNAGLDCNVLLDINVLGNNLGHWEQNLITWKDEIDSGQITGTPLDPPNLVSVAQEFVPANIPVIIEAVNLGGVASSWEWDFGPDADPSTSTNVTPMVTFGGGIHSCTVTASNLSGSSSLPFIIQASIEDYDIRGHISDVDGDPLQGVNLAFTPGGYAASSDSSGDFTIYEVPGGDYTLTPSLTGYVFSPANLPIQLVGDYQDANFIGSQGIPAPKILDVDPKGGLQSSNNVRIDANNIGGAADEYHWDFGGGAIPNTPTTFVPYVIVDFGAEGTYNASVRAVNSAGEDTYGFFLVISPGTVIYPPTNVEIIATPPGPYETGEDVVFSVDVDGTPPFTYSWNFDGGASPNSSSSSSVQVTIGSAGNYSASLTVTNSKGNDNDTHPYTVESPPPSPIAVISADPTHIETGEAVTFSGTGSYDPGGLDLIKYELNFYYNLNQNDWQDYTDTQGQVIYNYGNEGTHTAALRVKNSAGIWSNPVDTVVITVDPAPPCYPPVWGVFDVGDSYVRLHWTSRPPEENVFQYFVELYWQEVGGEAVFQRIVPSGDAEQTYIPDLVAETDYWAQIRSGNGNWSNWGPRKHFFTALPPTPEWNDQVVDPNRDGYISAIVIANGRPLIAYADSGNSDLYVVRANDPSGSSWGSPQAVDTAGTVGSGLSMVLIGGNPAISYRNAGSADDLKYVRATNTSGTSWGTPVTVDTNGNIDFTTSLQDVGGRPAIAYNISTPDYDLRYVRASNSSGSIWGTPVNVVTADDVRMELSMVVADGNPAIAYFDNGDASLNYIRATNSTGSSWGSIQVVDTNYGSGRYLSMAIVEGRPAIAYQDSYTQVDDNIRFVRASNASGSSWGTKRIIYSVDDSREYKLAVVGGKPAVAFYDFTSKNAMIVMALDTSGSSWSAAEVVDALGNVGWNPSLADVQGNPALAYKHTDNGTLKFAIKN